jgi:hypothetical protein
LDDALKICSFDGVRGDACLGVERSNVVTGLRALFPGDEGAGFILGAAEASILLYVTNTFYTSDGIHADAPAEVTDTCDAKCYETRALDERQRSNGK